MNASIESESRRALEKDYMVLRSCKFLMLVFLTAVALTAEGNYSEEELGEFTEIVESFSPLPVKPDLEIPGYRGPRFVFFHALRDLREYTKFFDPNDKNYLYRYVPAFGADPVIRLQNMKEAYEALLSEYEVMKGDPDFETYSLISGVSARPYPSNARYLLALAELIKSQFMAEVQVSWYLKKLLEQEKKRWPLFGRSQSSNQESVFELTAEGTRSRRLLEKGLFGTSEQLKAMQPEVTRLVELAVARDWGAGPENAREYMSRSFALETNLLDIGYQYQLTNEMVNRSLSNRESFHSNSRRGFSKAKSLEGKVRNLARSLVRLHKEVDLIAEARASGNMTRLDLRRSNEGVFLSNPAEDIPNLFRDHERDRVYKVGGIGVPDGLFRHYGGSDGIYRVYKESLVRQYILAVGFLTSQVAKRGRGGPGFLLQTSSGLLRLVSGRKTDSQIAVRSEGASFGSTRGLTTRLSNVNKGGASSEDRLWEIFFEEASEIMSSSENKNQGEAASSVPVIEKEASLSCRQML